MNLPSESVDSLTKITTRRRTRRRGRPHPMRLFVEELEPRCLLSSAALPGPDLLPLALSPEQAASRSINALGLNLYSLLQGQSGGSGNLFLSPASIAAALAMTDAGALSETASQIASVLHVANPDPNTLAQEFGSLLTDLNSAGQGRYALTVADALWGQQGHPFNQAFLNLVQAGYGGGLQQVDFAGNSEGARQTINDWVAQQTADKIQDLLPPAALSAYTRLVLTNAIYFKGVWGSPFNTSDTYDANFTLFSGDQVWTSTMHQTSEFGYMASDGYQVLEMPYVGGRIAMDVILPSSESGLRGLDASQLPADPSAWLGGLSEQQVQVSLPKFGMTTQFDLSAPLQTLGMTDAFSNYADFLGISPMALKISDVVHKAYVGVSETGTEAAAATGVVCKPTYVISFPSAPVVFNADHPFLFVIRDTQSGSVLFEGQVANPTSAAADPSTPPILVSHTKPAPDPVNAPVSPPTARPPLTAPPTVPPPLTAPPTVPPPLTAPPTFQGTNNSSPPVGPIRVTVAPPVASGPMVATAFVTVVAQSPGDPSQAQRLVAVPSPPALIYWSGPRADIMPVEASGQTQPDGSVAVQSDLSAEPSAASSAREDAVGSALSQPALAAAMQDQGLAADTSPVFMDPRGSGTSVQSARQRRSMALKLTGRRVVDTLSVNLSE
jgi:serpin B